MEFVVPGPGALDGIRKCFRGSRRPERTETIRFMMDRQETEFERLGLAFRTLWGRRLQLIDCQNLFCEVDKYSRVAHPEVEGLSGRLRIKQRFTPQSSEHAALVPAEVGHQRSDRGSRPVTPVLRTHCSRETSMDIRAYQLAAHQTEKKASQTVQT